MPVQTASIEELSFQLECRQDEGRLWEMRREPWLPDEGVEA